MPQPKLSIEERLIKYKISRERYNDETTRLLAVGFTQQQADKLIVRASSKNAVESVLIHYGALSKEPYDLSREQILAMASNGGGAQAMKTVLKYYPELSNYGYSLELITSLAARVGGATTIQRTNASEFSTFVRDYLWPLLPDKTPLNLDPESDDMDFWYRFCVDYEPAPQSYAQETIYQPQAHDFGVHEEESPYMVCEGDVNFIDDNNIERFEERNDDDLMFFGDYFDLAEEPLPSAKNSTALQTLGVFATTSSGYKRSRTEDNSTGNPPRKFLKQTPESTPSGPTV